MTRRGYPVPHADRPPSGEQLYRAGFPKGWPYARHLGRWAAYLMLASVLATLFIGAGLAIIRGIRQSECLRWMLTVDGAQNWTLDTWRNICRVQVTGGAWRQKP